MNDTIELQRATIRVVKNFGVKAGRKRGTIKDSNGDLWSPLAKDMPMYQERSNFDVEFYINEVDGTPYRNIERGQPVASQRTQAQVQREPTRQSAPIDPPQHEPRPNQGGNGNNYFRPTSPKDAKRMFICSQLNAIITSRQIDLDANSIAATIEMLSDAYDRTIGLDDPTD